MRPHFSCCLTALPRQNAPLSPVPYTTLRCAVGNSEESAPIQPESRERGSHHVGVRAPRHRRVPHRDIRGGRGQVSHLFRRPSTKSLQPASGGCFVVGGRYGQSQGDGHAPGTWIRPLRVVRAKGPYDACLGKGADHSFSGAPHLSSIHHLNPDFGRKTKLLKHDQFHVQPIQWQILQHGKYKSGGLWVKGFRHSEIVSVENEKRRRVVR